MVERAGVKIKYAYAHACDDILKYDAYAEEVVAEMVCYLSDLHQVSTDDIVITAEERLPKLEDRLMIYSKNVLYVILHCYLYHEKYIDLWPWHLHDIENMAICQRGIPKKADTQCLACDKKETDDNMGCALFSIKEDPDNEDETTKYPVPAGNPVMYHPIDMERAGMQNVRQQRSQMIAWAEQKVRTDAPQAQGKTLTMIMRAEPRTITAIMHAKSPSQTREVIIAAYKRAGLPSPFHEEQQEKAEYDMQTVVNAMTEQTRMTSEMVRILQEVPKEAHYAELVEYMRQSQASYTHAVEALAKSVSRLENTIATWEEAYLPQLLGQQRPRPPASTPCATDMDTEVGSQDYVSVHSGHREHTLPLEDMSHEDAVDAPPGFERIQTRSLRSCCERVVQDGAGRGESVGSAMRPFRARP